MKQAPLFAGLGVSPLCGSKMPFFPAFLSDPFPNMDTRRAFDTLIQGARATLVAYNRATSMFQTDASVAARTALIPFNQDAQPFINKRTTQAAKDVEVALAACQNHNNRTMASKTQFNTASAARIEKVREENKQHTFCRQQEEKRNERRLSTLDNEEKVANESRIAEKAEEEAIEKRLQKVLDTAEAALFVELRLNTKFLLSSGLLRTEHGANGGAAVGGAAVGAGGNPTPTVDVNDVVDGGGATAGTVAGAGDDTDFEEGEIRDNGPCLKRGRDDTDVGGPASKQGRLD